MGGRIESKSGIMSGGILIVALLVAVAHAQENNTKNPGAAVIKIDAGQMQPVVFPHRLHEERLKKCALCHDLFPEKSGIIIEMKKEGKLEKRQVMYGLCLHCHKERRHGGQVAGPVRCDGCHVRP